MLDYNVVPRCGGDGSNRFQRRRRTRKTGRAPSVLWLELVIVVCCYGVGNKPFGATKVMAFKPCSPQMSSSSRMDDRRLATHQKLKHLDATSLEVARELITQETSGSRRVTKKALLESIGYGVMDPIAYQTFENSPLLPKLRPTTHVRVAEGMHSFGQEFLGVPPRKGIPFSPESAAPSPSVVHHSSAESATSLPSFVLHPKLPGVGIRMTVLRLGNGELLVHSPVAPTVELLDMLRNSFPAVGSTTKIHLFSGSVSPEHWAFIRHWKDIFPSAEVWAVPGPHQRLMGVEVDHDIEHMSGVPGRLGGEVEIAVLEGVPMVREAVLLHRPTGAVLSAALLLAMDQKTLEPGDDNAAGELDGLSRDPSRTLPSTSSPEPPPLSLPKVFGQQSNAFEVGLDRPSDTDAHRAGRWRRLRWGLLDKTTTILNMNTLAVFAPVKTLLHAFKGNSAVFTARVLSWDARIFVGCYGQSPLEGPELEEMLHAALDRYVEAPKEAEKKKLGTRLKALIPGQRGGRNIDRQGDDAIGSEMRQTVRLSGRAGDNRGDLGGGRGGDGAPSSSVAGIPRQAADPSVRALPSSAVQSNSESRANYFGSGARQTVTQTQAESYSRRKSQTASTSSTETSPKTSASQAVSRATTEPGEARVSRALSDSATAGDSAQDNSIADPAITSDDETRGFNLADILAGWGKPGTGPPSATRAEGKRSLGQNQQATRIIQPEDQKRQQQLAGAISPSTTAQSTALESGGEGDSPAKAFRADISEVETRARSYLRNKMEATRTVGAVAPPTPILPNRTEVVGPEKKIGSTSTLSSEKTLATAAAEGSGNPLVVGPGSRYDERPAGSIADSEDDDPFEEPFFPFADDGPLMNG